MKKILSIVYYLWLLTTLAAAVYGLVVAVSLVWLGVLLVCVPPLLNVVWRFDNDDSPAQKTRFPRISLFMLLGVAWVLLTIEERSAALWLVLGALGGFLLHSYWAVSAVHQKR